MIPPALFVTPQPPEPVEELTDVTVDTDDDTDATYDTNDDTEVTFDTDDDTDATYDTNDDTEVTFDTDDDTDVTVDTDDDTGSVGGEVPLSTPVFYYSLDSGHVDPVSTMVAMDDGGAGDDGTLVGYSSSGDVVSGQVNQALQFDGSGQYVKDGNASLSSGEVTLAAWVNPDSVSSTRNIVGRWYLSGTWGYAMHMNAGDLRVLYRRVTGDSSDATFSSGYTVPTGQFTHAAATYSLTFGWVAYVNGLPYKTDDLSYATNTAYALQQPGTPFGVGALDDNGTWKWFFDGVIDEPRVVDGAVDAFEIAALANVSNTVLGQPLGRNFTDYTNDDAVHTFSVTTPHAGLLVICGYSDLGSDSVTALDYVNIDGAATSMPVYQSASNRHHFIAFAEVSAGAHSVTVHWTQVGTDHMYTSLQPWLLRDYGSATPHDHDEATGMSSSGTLSADVAAGGLALYSIYQAELGAGNSNFTPGVRMIRSLQHGDVTRYLISGLRHETVAQSPRTFTLGGGGAALAAVVSWSP